MRIINTEEPNEKDEIENLGSGAGQKTRRVWYLWRQKRVPRRRCDPQSQRLQAVGQYKDRGVTVGSSIRGATVDLGKVFAEAEDYPHR